VGLLDHGQLVGLLTLEKLDNIKNSGVFPKETINALLLERGMMAD
jgi:hypothetical protein